MSDHIKCYGHNGNAFCHASTSHMKYCCFLAIMEEVGTMAICDEFPDVANPLISLNPK